MDDNTTNLVILCKNWHAAKYWSASAKSLSYAAKASNTMSIPRKSTAIGPRKQTRPQKLGTKRGSCGKCKANLGECRQCKDTKKFGVPNKLRQRCCLRLCQNSATNDGAGGEPTFATTQKVETDMQRRIAIARAKAGYTVPEDKQSITRGVPDEIRLLLSSRRGFGQRRMNGMNGSKCSMKEGGNS